MLTESGIMAPCGFLQGSVSLFIDVTSKDNNRMSTSVETPPHLQYTKEHEWVQRHDVEWEIGITAFAAEQLGDVVFVELPAIGSLVTVGQPFGVVESVKSVSDLFAPVTGTVTAINTDLETAPEQVNEAPYGDGWMIRVKPDDAKAVENLLSAADYQAFVSQG